MRCSISTDPRAGRKPLGGRLSAASGGDQRRIERHGRRGSARSRHRRSAASGSGASFRSVIASRIASSWSAEAEAQTVSLGFEQYLALGSLPALQTELREKGIVGRPVGDKRSLVLALAVSGFADARGDLSDGSFAVAAMTNLR
jgi:hypothetical protein